MLSSQDWAPAPSKYILCWLAAPSQYLHSTNLVFVFKVSQCGFHFKLKWQQLFLHRMPLFVNQVCTTDSCAGPCYFLVPKELLCWVSVFLLFSLVLSWALLCSVSEQQMQIVLRIRVKFCWSCAFTWTIRFFNHKAHPQDHLPAPGTTDQAGAIQRLAPTFGDGSDWAYF